MRFLVAALIITLLPALTPLRTPAQVGAAAPPGTFGLDVGTAAEVTAAAGEGVAWIRIQADWSVLEPRSGTFAWTGLDALVSAAAGAKVRVAAVLAGTPKWAALDPTAPETVWRHQPPRRTADWQRFVGAAAARYRGRVAAWQVEPVVDFAAFRGTFQDYVEMLHAARLAIRQADPQAVIVSASSPELDLAYVKALFGRAADDFDAVLLSPRGRTPEEVLEALTAVRGRIADARHQVWLESSDAGPDDAVGDVMVRMATVGVAAGATREFWSRREASARWAPVRRTLARTLDGARLVGWLPRGAWNYAFVISGAGDPVAVMWSTAGDQVVPVAAGDGLKITTGAGTAVAAVTRDGTPAVPIGKSPVFVLGLAPATLEEASRASTQGPFQIPRDAAHDFSRADSVSLSLGAVNTEHGLYNQRFRSRRAGAVVPLTVDGVDAVRTDAAKDAVYVYLDVDHSFAYFVDGREDMLVAVEVHRAAAAQQTGFNILYDSMSGYRFSPWQWVEPGTGWVQYTFRLTDAAFSSAWGWDLAINGAGNKKEPLVVRSVSIRKIPRSGP